MLGGYGKLRGAKYPSAGRGRPGALWWGAQFVFALGLIALWQYANLPTYWRIFTREQDIITLATSPPVFGREREVGKAPAGRLVWKPGAGRTAWYEDVDGEGLYLPVFNPLPPPGEYAIRILETHTERYPHYAVGEVISHPRLAGIRLVFPISKNPLARSATSEAAKPAPGREMRIHAEEFRYFSNQRGSKVFWLTRFKLGAEGSSG